MTKILSIAVLAALLLLFVMPLRAVAAEPEELELPEVRFDGGYVAKVSLMDGKGWILVDYTKFIVKPDTEIREGDGMLEVGAFVDVRAERVGHKLIATRITVLPEDPGKVRLDGGKICVIDLAAYKVIVDGTTFITTADTKLDEGLMAGDIVKVLADRMDGKLIATEITLLD
jgi:Cu/Ag efflux protein CusF